MPNDHFMKDRRVKIGIIAAFIALTVGIHYGFVLEPLFGHHSWVHAIHGRFCYIPIVIAASWFGLVGGLIAAAAISVAVLPYIFLGYGHTGDISGELVEIVFYFAVAVLIGALIDREWTVRRKKEEAELKLERAHKLSLIGQIASGVAHEIKNPLASIKGAVEIIAGDTVSPAEKQEFQQIVRDEIRRVDGTIKEFLEFARPKPSKLERLNLSQHLFQTLKQLENQATKKGLAFKTEIESDTIVNGDNEKLRQVFLNLLLNAIEASSPGSNITVTLEKRSDNAARVSIRDTGIGIPRENIDQVFDPFFTTKSSGTGLGLAVVRAIIDDHQATINVNSELGHGAEFIVTMPLYKEDAR